MKAQRTDDPNVYIAPTDGAALWALGIVEFRIDIRDRKFIITPIYRGGGEGSSFEAPGGWETLLHDKDHDKDEERQRGTEQPREIEDALERLDEARFAAMSDNMHKLVGVFWAAIRKIVRDPEMLAKIAHEVRVQFARWNSQPRH